MQTEPFSRTEVREAERVLTDEFERLYLATFPDEAREVDDNLWEVPVRSDLVTELVRRVLSTPDRETRAALRVLAGCDHAD